MDEEFIIKLGVDKSDFDRKFNEAKKKIDSMADSVVIQMESDDLDSKLEHATAAMQKFKKEGQSLKDNVSILDKYDRKIKDVTKSTEALRNAMNKLSNSSFANKLKDRNEKFQNSKLGLETRNFKDKTKDFFANSHTVRGLHTDYEKVKGMRTLFKVPVPFTQDWNISGKMSSLFGILNMPGISKWLDKQDNPEKEDLSPEEALHRFKGMMTSKTYTTVFQDLFGSKAKVKSYGAILSNAYIDMKEALNKYNEEIKIAQHNSGKLSSIIENQLGKAKNTLEELGLINADDVFNVDVLEAKINELETNKEDIKNSISQDNILGKTGKQYDKLIEQTQFKLNIAETDLQQDKANKEIKSGTDEYRERVKAIQQLKAELFELQSVKENKGLRYEKAAEFNKISLVPKAKGSGEFISAENFKSEEDRIAEIDGILENLLAMRDAIKDNTGDMKAFDKVAEDAAKNIHEIVMDAQKNPDKEGFSSNILKKYNKQWALSHEEFNKNNPAKKAVNALERVGARMKQQMYSIIANWLNPIYVVQRAISEFMKRNTRYADTFSVATYNLFRVIEPLAKNLVDWVLKGVQYVNIFVKTWAGIDLFDKEKKRTDEIKNNLKNVTASFDELHDIGRVENPFEEAELPDIDKQLAKNLQKWANKLKPWAQKIGTMIAEAFKHPLKTILLAWLSAEIVKLLGTAFGSMLVNGVKNAFTGLFSWIGTGLSSIFASKSLFETGSLGESGFLGVLKTILGVCGLITGEIMAFSGAADLSHMWNELSNTERAFGFLKIAAGDTLVAISTFALTGGNILATLAVVGVSAIGQIITALSQNKTAIKGAKEELKEYEEAYEKMTGSYDTYMDKRERLVELEEQYGIKGEDLAKDIESGARTIDSLTYAQTQVYNAYSKAHDSYEEFKDDRADERVQLHETEIAAQKYEQNWGSVLKGIEEDRQKDLISQNQAKTLYHKAYAEMSSSARQTFTVDIPNYAQEGLTEYVATLDFMYQKTLQSKQKLAEIFNENPIKSNLWNGAKFALGAGMTILGGPLAKAGGIALMADSAYNLYTGNTGAAELRDNERVLNELDEDNKKSKNWGQTHYDIGTNYVPNDQLAIVHKGEAIIPEKYNRGVQGSAYSPTNTMETAQLQMVISRLSAATTSLAAMISEGIEVSGEFKQRGNDLYATVEKVKSQKGASIISDLSYAR